MEMSITENKSSQAYISEFAVIIKKMRLLRKLRQKQLDGVGVEWGTCWVIKYILQEELTAINTDEIFEESIRQCYPEETTVGWMKFDTVDLMKSQDPISWRIARDEYIDSLEQDEEIVSFDGGQTYYWIHNFEDLLY